MSAQFSLLGMFFRFPISLLTFCVVVLVSCRERSDEVLKYNQEIVVFAVCIFSVSCNSNSWDHIFLIHFATFNS